MGFLLISATENTRPGAVRHVLQAEGVLLPNPGWRMEGASFDTSVRLFRFVLEPSDPRWGIVEMCQTAQLLQRHKPVHMEIALRAEYLSEDPSFRNKFSSYISDPNVRHLCRAFHNISAIGEVQERFENSSLPLPTGCTLRLSLTNNFTHAVAGNGVTGCPEALFQVQLFERNKYLGRAGFNVHKEGEKSIVSITNLQGIPGGRERYESLESEGFLMLNELARFVRGMFSDSDGYEVRGLKDPRHGPARPVYKAVFKAEDIPMFVRAKRHKFMSENRSKQHRINS